MVSKRIFVSTVVTLSLVQFVTCNAIGLDETGTHSSQLQSEEKFDVNHINEDSSEFKPATKERSSEENVSENTEVPKVHGHSTGQSTIHLEVPKVHGHSTGQSTIHLEVHDTDEDALSTTSEDMAYSLMEQPADSHVESTPATL